MLVSGFFFVATLWPLRSLLRGFLGDRAAVWGCLLYVLTPKLIRFAGSGLLESGRNFFFTAALALLFSYLRAPSLKKADIGIAMGKNGSDVCRQASDMILTDDRFATIVDAVSEGRHLYMNIQKAVIYLLSCNLGEIMSLFLALLCLPGAGAPLRAVQILWINLVTDAFPALALGVDPKESDVMKQPPRPRSESLFAHGRMAYTVLNGMFIGTMTLVAFRWGSQRDIAHAQTMAFMVLSMSQLFHALNLRSLERSIFRAGLFRNRWLILTFLFGIGLQVIVCELPAAQLLLGTVHLDALSWVVVFGLSAAVVAINELAKLFHSAR